MPEVLKTIEAYMLVIKTINNNLYRTNPKSTQSVCYINPTTLVYTCEEVFEKFLFEPLAS